MSVLKLERGETRTAAVSGGAMDRVVATKKIDRRLIIGGGAAAVLLAIIAFWFLAPRAGDQSVVAERSRSISMRLRAVESRS